MGPRLTKALTGSPPYPVDMWVGSTTGHPVIRSFAPAGPGTGWATGWATG